MEPKLLHFSSCPDPLWVLGGLCANPDCDCGEVFFELLENDESHPSGLGAVKLSLRIDPVGWRELRRPARPASLDVLAGDFLREYPVAEREAWRAGVAKRSEAVRRMREYRFDLPTMESGELIAFGDIVTERGSISSGGASAAFAFEHDGVDYVADDLYCPNPDCHCGDVHLMFFRHTWSEADQAMIVENCFTAKLSLEGDVQSMKCHRMKRGQATDVLKAWRDSPDFVYELERFEWRYGKVKEIAERSYQTEDAHSRPSEDYLPPTVETLRRSPRVGRNEPCPCGSGKKYKKCCGKATGSQ